MPHLSRLKADTHKMLRAARARVPMPLTSADDAWLAAEYNRARGYDRPRAERAKEALEDLADAPMQTWRPSALRHHSV